MNATIARGLRRIVDALQRSLFDDDVPAPIAPSTSAGSPSKPAPPSATKPPSSTPEPDAPPAFGHPQGNREIVLDGQRVGFVLRRSKRRTIGFVVGADGLVVSAPKWTALREIDTSVREKGSWILAKLAEQRERMARVDAARIVWENGAEFMFVGRPVRIVLDGRRGLAAGEVVLDASSHEGGARELHVGLPHDAAADRLRDAVQSWLQREALALFKTRAAHFAAELGVRVTRLSLSSAQTRWGSASATGAIRLHWRLVHFPIATIDYVVAHELAHLREMNHSARFWEVVRSVVPEYEAARSELRGERLAAFE